MKNHARESRGTPVVGLMALDRDVVIESDLHALLSTSCSLVTTRMHLGAVGSVRHLELLKESIPSAVGLLVQSEPAVLAFGCTSGVAAIGRDEITRRVAAVTRSAVVPDPLTGIVDGLAKVGARNLGLVTPYNNEVSDLVADWFDQCGLGVTRNVRIDAGEARHYAAIERAPIFDAVLRARTENVEAVVIACTDLRVLHLIDELEERFGLPVLSSNQALAWAISRALDNGPIAGPGRLFVED